VEKRLKTIGLLGGMSWESTVPYYRIINQVVGERLGGLHSARLVLISVDFHEIEVLQHRGRWDESGQILADAALRLEAAGAEVLVLCTNTMHRVAPAIQKAIRIPLLHIADATAAQIGAVGLERVGLLGTRFTMEQEFYRGRLEKEHGIEVLVPDGSDREAVHRVIYEELCKGVVREDSRSEYRRIISKLIGQGAQGVILGCTEIAMLIGPSDVELPLFDTAEIHARAAASWALDTA
jgi:aspartate racemase